MSKALGVIPGDLDAEKAKEAHWVPSTLTPLTAASGQSDASGFHKPDVYIAYREDTHKQNKQFQNASDGSES